MLRKTLTERPVAIEEWHACRSIGVEHLFGRNDFDLIWKSVETNSCIRDLRDSVINPLIVSKSHSFPS